MNAKTILLTICTAYSAAALAQADPLPYPQVGLSLGYGNLGAHGRIDIRLTEKYLRESSTRLYLDFGGQTVVFEQKNFLLNNIKYPSDCRVLSFGVGIAQEFRIGKRVGIMPFVGLRNEYVRFKNQQLVDAIEQGGNMQRYSDTAMLYPVGPPIVDAYGDAAALDLGCRFGVLLGKRVELSFTAARASIAFDSAETLFGQYWGEYPYANSYWVKRPALRYEFALRFHFTSKT